MDKTINEIAEYKANRKRVAASGIMTTTEKTLKDIYIKVFQNEDIGLDDNLIDLGGDSLMLIRIQEEIQIFYPGKVNIANIYANPTIRKTAALIDENKSELPSSLCLKEENSYSRRKEKFGFTFVLSKETVDELNSYSAGVKSSLEVYMLSAYSYLWLEKSGASQIIIYTKLKEWNDLRTVYIHNGVFDSFEDYIVEVDKAVNTSFFSIELDRYYKEKGTSQVWISFVSEDESDEYAKYSEWFDFSIRIEKNDIFAVKCDINSNLFSSEEAEEIFGTYINIVNQLIGKIDSLV